MNDSMAAACVKEVCRTLLTKKDLLNELDAVMGDGEHGSNIERTFGAVQREIPKMEEQNLDTCQILDRTGSVLLAAGGGTATTLMGFACKKNAVLARQRKAANPVEIGEIMRRTWESIHEKSKAEQGDKTLMDAYTPAVQAFQDAAKAGDTLTECFQKAAEAAEKGAEDTKQMIAKRGRGYYVGERGIGTADPGAVSVSAIFRAISNALQEIS